ncbi:MAG TPA: hypothetical protein VN726_16310 [Hanamia sp.]|nr:hypothetical protein [Hanamia sp.]
MENNKLNSRLPDDQRNFPRVSLIIPFDSRMKKQPGLFNLLSSAADKTEKQLLLNYSKERVVPVINKLRHLIKSMICKSDQKTIGIFVSPHLEKLYYFTPSDPAKDYLPPVLVVRLDKRKNYLK